MREKQLIAAVHRQLPKTAHHQSMTLGSRSFNGVPDQYYDGPKSDLWIEYKQLKSMPRNGIVIGAYSALQLRWMERRYRHSRARQPNVIGVVGLPDRTAVVQFTPAQWREGAAIGNALSIKEISLWIRDYCGW